MEKFSIFNLINALSALNEQSSASNTEQKTDYAQTEKPPTSAQTTPTAQNENGALDSNEKAKTGTAYNYATRFLESHANKVSRIKNRS